MKIYKVNKNGKINIFLNKEAADSFIANQIGKCTLTCDWINPDEVENFLKRLS